MRLWHYKLIPYLPNQMLISQWRECIAIKRQWEKGTLKHRLVSYVLNHSKNVFVQYVMLVKKEMENREIKYQKKFVNEFYNFADEDYGIAVAFRYPEHNNRYLVQCYYNLQEKADRGIVSKENIEELTKALGDLLVGELKSNDKNRS